MAVRTAGAKASLRRLRMSNAAKGAWWMIAAAGALTAMAICIRYLPTYSVLLMIFLRNVINLVLMTPSMVRQGKAIFRTERLGTHAIRNAFLYSGNVRGSSALQKSLLPTSQHSNSHHLCSRQSLQQHFSVNASVATGWSLFWSDLPGR